MEANKDLWKKKYGSKTNSFGRKKIGAEKCMWKYDVPESIVEYLWKCFKFMKGGKNTFKELMGDKGMRDGVLLWGIRGWETGIYVGRRHYKWWEEQHSKWKLESIGCWWDGVRWRGELQLNGYSGLSRFKW